MGLRRLREDEMEAGRGSQEGYARNLQQQKRTYVTATCVIQVLGDDNHNIIIFIIDALQICDYTSGR